jgi:hypothetical protein
MDSQRPLVERSETWDILQDGGQTLPLAESSYPDASSLWQLNFAGVRRLLNVCQHWAETCFFMWLVALRENPKQRTIFSLCIQCWNHTMAHTVLVWSLYCTWTWPSLFLQIVPWRSHSNLEFQPAAEQTWAFSQPTAGKWLRPVLDLL